MKKILLLCTMMLSALVNINAQTSIGVSEGDSTYTEPQEITVTFYVLGEAKVQYYTTSEVPFYSQRAMSVFYLDSIDTSFLYDGMPHFEFPFLGWSKSDVVYDPVQEGEFFSSDVNLYAAFNAYGDNGGLEYNYEWSAKPLTSYPDFMQAINEGGMQLFVVGANDSGVVYFPAAPEAQTYSYETEDSMPVTTSMYVVNDRIRASQVYTGISEDGSMSGVDIERIAAFNLEPHYSSNVYPIALPSGDSVYVPTGFHLQDFQNKGFFMPLLSDDNIRFNLVSQNDNIDVFDESLLWQVSLQNGVPYLTFNGMDMPMTLVYDNSAPYFFATSTMDVTGTPIQSYDMSKLTLYRLTEREVKTYTEPKVYPVFDFNTILLNTNVEDMAISQIDIDIEWLEAKAMENSIYAEIPCFMGEEEDSDSIIVSPVVTTHLHVLEGFSLPLIVTTENPDMYRVHWLSSDSLYNDVYSNRLVVTPLYDIDLTYHIEAYHPVIVIAGDTVTLNPDSEQVIDLSDDGSITYDLTTNTITLDSAAVTGTGISFDLQEFTLQVENNSTIAVDDEYGIKFDGEYLSLVTDNNVMLSVQAPQPLVGNGGTLYLDGNFIFSSVEFRITAGQAAGHRHNIRRMPADVVPLVRPAVSGFANVELAAGIEIREVYYSDGNGNTTQGDPAKTHYHAAEAAYGEVDVDTQSFTPATSIVFADSNFYTDYIDGKIEIVSGLERNASNDALRVRKVVKDGSVFIIRDGNIFTILGTVVR